MAVSDALVVNAEIERTDLNNPANLNNSIPISAADLIQIEFPPTAWIVRDVLPEGVTLLAGKPKKGKSWLALALAEAVASGGVALGNKSVEQGRLCILPLRIINLVFKEDSARYSVVVPLRGGCTPLPHGPASWRAALRG